MSTYQRIRHIAIILSIFIVSLISVSFAFAQSEYVVFGPKQYDKPKGRPVTYTDTFHATSTTGTYTLWVQSGAEGLNEVKNVSVSINGVEIIDSRNLRATNPVSKTISVQSTNTLTVTLKGQGGNYITVKVLCERCYPSATGTIPSEGGTVTLEGYASVIFSAGAFTANQDVTVSATSFPETQEDYIESGSIFKAAHRLPYEIRINSGFVQPASSFDVILNVPDAFINTLPSNAKMRLFVQIYQDGGMEVLDNFEIFRSIFDPVTKTVRATLPKEVFTSLRHIENTYEAVIIIGSTLK